MGLTMIPFNGEKIKINRIFKSGELDTFKEIPVSSGKIRQVYGSELAFPESREDRPYIVSSFVTSIDGKLAYADKPSAFYVAGKNMMAGSGRDTDFWILNALRGVCDGAVIGGNSMKTDEDYSMHCMDGDIEASRVEAGLPRIPLNIVMTLDATDVPLEHNLLKSREVPSIMVTSPKGLEHIMAHFKGPYIVAAQGEPDRAIKEKLGKAGQGVLPILITGQGGFPDSTATMRILKMMGIDRLLIESPGYGHYLVKQKIMDEFFLNLSGVYIGGGDTMTLGKADKGFGAESHPHAKILSIHMYNEYFAYVRYKFNYGFL